MHVAHTAPAAPGARPVVLRDRFLRLPEVEAVTGCKKSTIYKLMKEGTFPKCVNITRRMSGWPETAILQWVQDRINQASRGQA